MKCSIFLTAAGVLALAGFSAAAPPEITLTTPAEVRGGGSIISGTAVDTEESTGGGGNPGTGGGGSVTTGVGGIREVLYQYEGESKWRKALLTSRGELETVWIAEVNLKFDKPKRIYFFAVDRAGNDGPVLGRRFTRVKGTGSGGGANNPPVLTVANRSHAIGAMVDVAITASDADGDALTYSATGLPTGLAIAPSTGRVTGTVAEQAVGGKSVTVTVTDGKGGTDTETFTWTVTAAQTGNSPPAVVQVVNQSVTAGEQISIQVEATDTDTPLQFSANGLPVGVTINQETGVISGNAPAAVTNQNFTVNVFVSDSKGATSTMTFTIAVNPIL